MKTLRLLPVMIPVMLALAPAGVGAANNKKKDDEEEKKKAKMGTLSPKIGTLGRKESEPKRGNGGGNSKESGEKKKVETRKNTQEREKAAKERKREEEAQREAENRRRDAAVRAAAPFDADRNGLIEGREAEGLAAALANNPGSPLHYFDTDNDNQLSAFEVGRIRINYPLR